MSTAPRKKPENKSLPAAVIVAAAAAAIGGAAVGAVVLAVGVYLASYSDRLVPFYQAGAFAGSATGAVYVLLSLWSQGSTRREEIRPLIAALVGTMVLWAGISTRALGMSVAERVWTGLLWFGGATLLLLVIRRMGIRKHRQR